MSEVKKLIPIFILLNILDCITTYIGLQTGLIEANFLLSGLFTINVFLGLGAKMGLSIATILLLVALKKLKLLKVINIALGVVVLWNLSMILIF